MFRQWTLDPVQWEGPDAVVSGAGPQDACHRTQGTRAGVHAGHREAWGSDGAGGGWSAHVSAHPWTSLSSPLRCTMLTPPQALCGHSRLVTWGARPLSPSTFALSGLLYGSEGKRTRGTGRAALLGGLGHYP